MRLTTTVEVIESSDPKEYPQFAEAYDLDGCLHVECLVSGKAEDCDYGVPGSPRWTEVTDIDVEEYAFNGFGHEVDDVKLKFGDTVEKELFHLAIDLAAEKEDWE